MDLDVIRSDPQHRRCGVGYYTDTQERAWLPLLGIKQSVYRADFLAFVLLKSANCMKFSVTVSGLSRLCKPYKPEEDTPKAKTGTSKRGPNLPCSL
eukprot:5525403-Amphidinium_carterae.1